MSDHRGTENGTGGFDFPTENVIPPAVRRQAKAAQEVMDAEIARRTGAAPAQETQPTTVVNGNGAGAAPQTGQQAPPAPAQNPDEWQQKYFSLKGKYDAEVPSLNLRARNAEGEVARLMQRISHLEGLIAARAPTQTAPTPTPAAPEISPEDREAYGEDLINRARAWARAEVSPEIAQLRHQLEQVRGQTTESATASRQQQVASHLDRVIPNWTTINEDPKFIAWLNQHAPYSSELKIKLIQQAHANGDAVLVARFFQDYLNEQTAQTGSEPAPTHTPSGAERVPLENLAAPGPGRATSPGAPQARQRTWTHAQIAAFYSDVNKGKFRDREAQRAELERDIFAAPAEGRLLA